MRKNSGYNTRDCQILGGIRYIRPSISSDIHTIQYTLAVEQLNGWLPRIYTKLIGVKAIIIIIHSITLVSLINVPLRLIFTDQDI